MLILWFIRQYRWKKEKKEITGKLRKIAQKNHEKRGEMILWGGILVVFIAFSAKLIVAKMEGKNLLNEMIPKSLHGWTGPLGLILLWIMSTWGRKIRDSENKNSFAQNKLKHSRAADLIIILIIIHGFLGFLYIFSVI